MKRKNKVATMLGEYGNRELLYIDYMKCIL